MEASALRDGIESAAAKLRRPVLVSFEFFPPGDAEMERTMWESIQRLAPLAPRFVSVTYGADGSTRERTHNTVTRILARNLPYAGPAPDLHRCAARGDPRHRARLLGRGRASHRRAARRRAGRAGDLPAAPRRFRVCRGPREGAQGPSATSTSRSRPTPRCTRKRRTRTSTSTTSRRKIDAGAHRAITQFFFDTDAFLRFRDRCAARGLDAQLVPGILPITRFPQMLRFAKRCGASVPDWLQHRFDGLDDDPDTRRLIAANVAIEQVHRLQEHGIQEFHFYTLNRAELTYAICHALGVRPAAGRAAAGA